MFLDFALFLVAGVLFSDCKVLNEAKRVKDENGDYTKIVGGWEARKHAYRFMAKLYITDSSNDTYGCGGALINRLYVLTAAHCVVFEEPLTEIKVILGAHDLAEDEATTITRYSSEIKTLNYNKRTLESDIALLRLSEPVIYNQYVGPICLQRAGIVLTNIMGVLAGWGFTEHGTVSDILLVVKLPILDDSICTNMYHKMYNKEVMMCAGDVNYERSACVGDSGGALFGRQDNGFNAYGIVSFTKGCPGPSVFTRVETFLGWIRQTAVDGGSICQG